MANKFWSSLVIDFETDQDVPTESFKAFKRAFDKMVEDEWEMMLYDLAEQHGFEIIDIHPIMEDSPLMINE